MSVQRWCPECEEIVELDDSEDCFEDEDDFYPIEDECCGACGEVLVDLPTVGEYFGEEDEEEE